jgi:diacylglycerol kinase (ATP)
MKLTIIANPVAGRGRPYRKVARYIRSWPHREWEVELIPTRWPGHAGVIARDLLAEPPDVLAVCGGDGTMKEVVTGVPDPPFPVALLPAGTANVLAREFDLPLDPVQAIKIALEGKVRRLDLGSLEAREHHHFLLMAGVGFDAYTAASVHPEWKKRLGIGAYYIAVVRSLLLYPMNDFQIVTAESTWSSSSCIIANAKGYGGGLRFHPQADMTDGMLDVLLVQHASRMDYLRFILSARLGRIPSYPFLQRARVRSLSISGPRGLWVQVDGEPVGSLPVTVSVAAARFPLIAPS